MHITATRLWEFLNRILMRNEMYDALALLGHSKGVDRTGIQLRDTTSIVIYYLELNWP